MKPFKAGLPFATWLMRISLALFLVLQNVNSLSPIELSNLSYYFTLAFVVFAILLFVGGFFSKPTLTVVSGLVITGLSIYRLVVSFDGAISQGDVLYLIVASVAFYFVCQGNK